MTSHTNTTWERLCCKSDLIPHSGIAIHHHGKKLALFYIPDYDNQVYAIDNLDPFSGAEVLAHGLVGDLQGELMVSAPLYKQHFSLKSGTCLEDAEVSVPVWPVRLQKNQVEIIAD